MKELVEFVTRSLVSHPERVTVNEIDRDGTRVLRLEVHPEDVGIVIGRKRRTVWAIQALLDAAQVRQGTSATVEVLESEVLEDAVPESDIQESE